MSDKFWLGKVLSQAVEEGWCVRIGCTTCDCGPFREAVKKALVRQSRGSPINRSGEMRGGGTPRRPADAFARLKFSRDQCMAILDQLALVAAPVRDLLDQYPSGRELENRNEAIRLLLFLCWQTLGGEEAEAAMSSGLSGTYAGTILDDMRCHEARRARERAERQKEQSPQAVAQRKAERVAKTKAAQEQRAAEKEVREQRLIALGEVRYGPGLSRGEIFRRLHSDGVMRGNHD